MQDPVKRNKRHATKWEKLFANHISVKGLYPQYMKNTQNSLRKQPNNKICKIFENTLLKKIHDGKYIHEKMSNIINN